MVCAFIVKLETMFSDPDAVIIIIIIIIIIIVIIIIIKCLILQKIGIQDVGL